MTVQRRHPEPTLAERTEAVRRMARGERKPGGARRATGAASDLTRTVERLRASRR